MDVLPSLYWYLNCNHIDITEATSRCSNITVSNCRVLLPVIVLVVLSVVWSRDKKFSDTMSVLLAVQATGHFMLADCYLT
jgi:hypothetical protein